MKKEIKEMFEEDAKNEEQTTRGFEANQYCNIMKNEDIMKEEITIKDEPIEETLNEVSEVEKAQYCNIMKNEDIMKEEITIKDEPIEETLNEVSEVEKAQYCNIMKNEDIMKEEITIKDEPIEETLNEVSEVEKVQSSNANIKSEVEADYGLLKFDENYFRNELSFESFFGLENCQSFPHFESNNSLPESIKKELDQMAFTINSEGGESKIEFGMDEEQVENNVNKSENPAMITKLNAPLARKFMSVKNVTSLINKVKEKGLKAHFESEEEEYFAQVLASKSPLLILKNFSPKEIESLTINAGEGEEDLDGKRTSVNKPQRAIRHQQNIKYNVENLSCRDCNFSFRGKDELKTHLKTHNKRKFKCAQCSYECNLKSRLNKHMLIHSNIKLHRCSDCSYESNYKGNLKRHMLRHANAKLFKCSDCSYECNYKESLKKHKLKH